MGIKEELIKNIKTFFQSANILYERKDYTSACVLYFKSLFAVLDYILLTAGKGTPKDHVERFQSLKSYSTRFYTLLDKLYPIYRSTYSISINKTTCDEVKENVEKLIKELEI